jgi:hypothetical protein
MTETRVKISNIIENQLPQFVRESSPLLIDFLRQYYISIESKGQTLDILENIDQYVKLDNLTQIKEKTVLTSNVSFFDTEINVESTLGFPDSYGLIEINDEIISYESKTSTSFLNCHRGFGGIQSYEDNNFESDIIFEETNAQEHNSESVVINLSVLFLKKFLEKIKYQFSPGFENRDFDEKLNENIFIKQVSDFYSSKGTSRSFEILFRALYGENVKVINPSNFILRPSDSRFLITKDIVVEELLGNPEELLNQSLFQDNDGYFSRSTATITRIEKFFRLGKPYYTLSLDYNYDRDINTRGSLEGEFSIHPKTKIIDSVIEGQDFIDVDSTIGFPNSGQLVVNKFGVEYFITYGSKTLNQFLECDNVPIIEEKTDISLNSYAYGFSNVNDNEIRVRIRGVLSDLNILDNTFLSDIGDTIKIISPGKILTKLQSKNWFYNISITYDLVSPPVSGIVETFDEHNFLEGDDVIIEVSDGSGPYITKISKVRNKNIVIINPQLPSIDLNFSYKIRRKLSKCKFNNYPELLSLNSNVQNVYEDINNNDIYVTSPSLPNYFNTELNISDESIIINGLQLNNTIVIQNHPFITGDLIYYSYGDTENNLNIPERFYYVKKINSNSIKFSLSKEDLFLNNFVFFDDVVVENNKITFYELFDKKLESQKIIRKLQNPKNDSSKHETPQGKFIGLFLNGVEILNYKSNDYVYFGPIEKVDVLSNLDTYDIISPPIVEISDPNGVGIGASAILHTKGNLKKINIIDTGFDYLNTPQITIFGGNGEGAKAFANLSSFDHVMEFNSENASVVSLLSNSITFSVEHKFRDVEQVVYQTNNQSSIGGLVNNTKYFLKTISEYQIKLYLSEFDAINQVNEIILTSLGNGIHSIKSVQKKKKITSIVVENSGLNYTNRKILVDSKNINVKKNTIVAKNHGYSDKDIIEYYSFGDEIGGVDVDKYYIKVINENEFSLVQIVDGENKDPDFNFKSNNVINFENSGSGLHYFNYPSINIDIKGIVGVNTFSKDNSLCKIQPIFRGIIDNVFIFSNGENYGSEEIINYERQPEIKLINGSGALFKPIILNGKIEKVLVLNGGNNYISPPDLEIIGNGNGAVLTPILKDGKIIEIKVISTGIGYEQNKTQINVLDVTKKTSFKSKIKSYNINNYFRFLNSNIIKENQSILTEGLNDNYGLQYASFALSNSLRENIITSKIFEDISISIFDKENDDRTPNSRIHSPIVGWAYDGNPIYGPYGFDDPSGGIVRKMESGYKLKTDFGKRPRFSLYPIGYFVEDYEYVDIGDLDEHNGRYCITPDFPDGVYAYFCTIDLLFNPLFPYVIGNSYKSIPIDFNFDKNSNQDQIDLNETNWVRNAEPYKFLSDKSSYDYVLNPNKIKPQESIVSSTESGSIDSIYINLPGEDYKVGEKVIFETVENDFGFGASAKISEINGKNILDIKSNIKIIEKVEFSNLNIIENTIGISSIPHNLLSKNIITLSDSNNKTIILNNNFYDIVVSPSELILRSDVGDFNVTGEIAYFEVYGDLNYPYVIEDDIFTIGLEKIKILSIDFVNKRIKVLRGYDSTPITEHKANSTLIEDPRKIYINTELNFNSKLNRKYYFDPKETVGIGTTSGVGIGSTVFISNPGVGITQIFVSSRSLYLPNHKLNTGDLLSYNSNSGLPIKVSNDGIDEFLLENNSLVYVAKINDNFIGISTSRVGISSNGDFVGIGTSSSILYFKDFGSGNNHSFLTIYDNTFTANVNNISVEVSTNENTLLNVNDNITLNVDVNDVKIFTVFYDINSRNLIFNKIQIEDIEENSDTLIIQNHPFVSGQKVVFNSFNPPDGLNDGEKYYIIKVNNDTIQLSKTYYGSLNNEDIVSIELAGSAFADAFLSLVNPPLEVYKNQTIIFNLSDVSLLGFDFNLYEDKNYNNVFNGKSILSVKKNGIVGEPNANLTLRLDNTFPDKIYYNLTIPDIKNIFFEKVEYFIDVQNISNNNTIFLRKSAYDGKHTITGIGTSSFTFSLGKIPEKLFYQNEIDSKTNYTTTSKNSLGSISKIKINSKGKNYKKLPLIKSIESQFGKNALLEPRTNSIGKISSININDIGFDYFSDKTIRPLAKIPEILKVAPLTSLDSISVIELGENYNTAPKLIVIDGFTNKIISDLILDYNIEKNEVKVIKNTTGIYNVTPKIIPISNSNGININIIEYNSNEKEISVFLNDSYSDITQFPFVVGDFVLIENTNIIENTGKKYDSINYDYKLYSVKQIFPQIGGENPKIILDAKDFIQNNEIFGQFDSQNSYGVIVPEKYFPKFDVRLKKNLFLKGESIISGQNTGIVEYWDKNNELLKVNTTQNFQINTILIGNSSDSRGLIVDKFDFNSIYNIDSSSIVVRSWQDNYGFLNDDLQRIPDNYYYQYFSYSLRSKVDFNTWENAVSSLNHTSGFKKFSDLDVEIQDKNYSGIQTSQNNGKFNSSVDLISLVDLNCKNDYDLVAENSNVFDSKLVSDKIIFESKELFDYFNCIGNRVLSIDDISDQFRSKERLNFVNRFRL